MADRNKPGGGSPQASASDLVQEAQGVAAKLADTAQEKARGVLSTAEEKARELAEAKKREAAEQVDSVAKVVDSVAEQVESAIPQAGTYVRGVAEEIHRVSSSLRESSVDELMDEARRFAQQRPGLVLGGAVVLGFGLARFLKASADRRAVRMRHQGGGQFEPRGRRQVGAERSEAESGLGLAGSAGPARAAGQAATEGGRSDGR